MHYWNVKYKIHLYCQNYGYKSISKTCLDVRIIDGETFLKQEKSFSYAIFAAINEHLLIKIYEKI